MIIIGHVLINNQLRCWDTFQYLCQEFDRLHENISVCALASLCMIYVSQLNLKSKDFEDFFAGVGTLTKKCLTKYEHLEEFLSYVSNSLKHVPL